MAFESYVECVKAFPCNSSTSPGQIESIVHNLTYLGTCDLLLSPENVSLKTHAIRTNHAVIGQLLEWQLDCLQSHLFKEGVKEVTKFLFLQALECYQVDEPVKRAQILVKCLEFIYHVGSDSSLVGGWHAAKMGSEVEKMLDRVRSIHCVHPPGNQLWFRSLLRTPHKHTLPSTVWPLHDFGSLFTPTARTTQSEQILSQVVPMRVAGYFRRS
jgi:hypothetical protein